MDHGLLPRVHFWISGSCDRVTCRLLGAYGVQERGGVAELGFGKLVDQSVEIVAQRHASIILRSRLRLRAYLLAVGAAGVVAADGVLPEAMHGDGAQGLFDGVDAQAVGVAP